MMKSSMNIFSINGKATISLIVASILSSSTYSQKVTSDDLLAINGNWEGKLIYVDYGDDKTQYALVTKLEATWEDGAGKLKFEFKEPNGKLVYSTEKMKLIGDDQFKFDTKWQIIDFEKNEASWTLILESNGKDNNKNSMLREEINYADDTLIIKKMVKYDGTDSFFLRSGYEFSKISTND